MFPSHQLHAIITKILSWRPIGLQAMSLHESPQGERFWWERSKLLHAGCPSWVMLMIAVGKPIHDVKSVAHEGLRCQCLCAIYQSL
jgi:hypothetical protein